MSQPVRWLATLLFCAAVPLFADSFNVTLATAPLIGNPGGPFTLDFQFTDGSGTSDGNNTISLTNFDFGGGSAGAAALTGGAGGDAVSGFFLTDSSFFNDIALAFTPGSSLSFNVTTTSNVDDGAPDLFSLGILDQNGFNIPTTAGSFFDVFVEITLDSAIPSVATYESDTSRLLSTGDSTPGISAPSVTAASPVPEPGGMTLLIGGFAALPLVRRLKR